MSRSRNDLRTKRRRARRQRAWESVIRPGQLVVVELLPLDRARPDVIGRVLGKPAELRLEIGRTDEPVRLSHLGRRLFR